MNYLSTHLKEAVAINKHRAPLYSALSNGASEKVSSAILQSERLSLSTSLFIDKAAAFWQKRGIPVLVHEYVSMEHTPSFQEQFSDTSNISPTFPSFPIDGLMHQILEALKQDAYGQVASITAGGLKDLSIEPKHLCLVRHITESIHRGANLLPMHLDKVKEKNLLISPKKLCHYLLWAQTVALKPSYRIDEWAYPIQRKGIPIIYQDIPYVPPLPEKY